MKALRHLNKFFWKYRLRFALGVFFIVLTNVFTVYSPQLVKEAVDFLAEMGKSEQNVEANQLSEIKKPASFLWFQDLLGWDLGLGEEKTLSVNSENWGTMAIQVAFILGLIYILVFIVKGMFSFMTRQTIIIMSRLIEYDLKNEVFDHYQKLDMAFYKRNKTGDLMNRISEDVSKVRMYLGPAVLYTLNLLVLIVMVVGVMAYVDWELTLWALAPLPFMSLGVYYVSSTINKRSEKTQRQQSQLSNIVQESISGIRVLKAYGREPYQSDFFKHESDIYKMRVLDLVKIDALFIPIIVLLVGLSTILTIYMGGLKVIEGSMELGTIFSFVFYVNLLTWPFASVGWVTSLVQKAEASQERINEFLETEPTIVNHQEVKREVGGAIRFDKVSFTYPDSGIRAIQNLSFSLEQGQTLAVIGRTGSGKSTLAHLICRMYDVDQGAVLIDEIDVKNHHLYSLRDQMGYVPQDVFLFSDTVYSNIAFGIEAVEESEVVDAAKMADIHENILQFSQGYQTMLGERGINLSGGQKQRLSIARAIIKNPHILVFDDCLSAVDTATEEKILSGLKTIMKDKTSVIISHRVSSVKHADKIIVLDQGRLIEEGTHNELLQLKGVYAELYQKQLLEDRAA